jgi:DNA-binding transcriptional regulator YiaG
LSIKDPHRRGSLNAENHPVFGCDPTSPAIFIPRRLAAARKRFGLAQPKMAAKLSVERSTPMGWEAARYQQTGKSVDVVAGVLETCY